MGAVRAVLVLSILLLPIGNLQAEIFAVTKTADTDDGLCDDDCSLREAIGAANLEPGADDVPVPAGHYLLTLGQLVVSDDVNIAGAGQESTIIDGNASGRVLSIAYSGIEISDVTIQNGSSGFGGGIFNGGDATLTNSRVSGNAATDWGGGIFNGYGGRLTLTNGTVSGNSALMYGGGIAHFGWGTVTVTDSTLSGNAAGLLGGGIFNYYAGAIILADSTLSGNAAESGGGIANLHLAETTLANTTVSGNAAVWYGGGIANWVHSGLALMNSTVSGNTAYDGGGISNGDYSGMTLANSTVSGNSALRYGGGIESWYVQISDAEIDNSIVAGNSAVSGYPNCYGLVDPGVTSLGHNLTDDTSCDFSAPGDLVVDDAMLGPLADNGGPTETHDLLPGSPAIDAGSAGCPPPATDQRGVARPQGAACDIGAVEYVPEPARALLLAAGLGCLVALRRVSRRR